MALHYRGVVYNPAPEVVDAPESNITGHYRGATWKIRQPVTTAKRSDAHLKYRGAWVR
ncbi:MAG: DUF4278 domain-containing protein [Synechococcales bacterium]|nr:DUF4278 domain-containing protein [Synechococcales bacterium]